jgi:YD repeat-containing protein
MSFRRSVSMNEWRSRRFNLFTMAAITLAACFPSLTVRADEVTFEYDALGRLIQVERSDGTKTLYQLDAAGNRTEVKEGLPTGIPASITVPATAPSGSYTISWTAPAAGTVSTYELYESATSSFSSQTLVYSGTALSKAFTAKPNGTYYYRVRACGLDCSGYRTGADDIQVRPTAPASITSPAQSTNGSFTVSWGTSTGSFSRYQLQEASTSSFSSPTTLYEGSNTSFSVQGRGNGTYHYRVRACGTGLCSVYRSGASTTVLLAPEAPASIAVGTTTSSGDYSVSWGAAASGTVTTYELWEATNSSFTGATRVHEAASTVWSVTGKANGTYYYRARACYQTSCSGYTTAGNSILVDRDAPGAPQNLTYSVNGTSVTVSWGAASDNVGVTSYEYRLNGAASWQGQGSGLSRVVTGLVAFTTYTIDVQARDAVGNYGPAARTSFTTGTDAPPQPTNLNPAMSAPCEWRASWSASSGATYYRFKRNGADEETVSGTQIYINFNCSTSSHEATKPQYVKACNSIACSLPSNFYIGDVTKPTTPGVPQFSSVTHVNATASWGHSSDASGIAYYQYRLAGVTSWTTNGTTNTVALTGLSPSTTYTFEVKARDGAGLESNVSSAPLSTPEAPDTTAPGAPGSLVIDNVTHAGARATWTASYDAVGVSGYEYRRTGQSSWTWIGNVLTVFVGSLTPQSTYTFEVRAKDTAGNTGSISNRNFTTTAAPPNPPTGLSYSKYFDDWKATWNSVDGATYYMLRDTQGAEKPIYAPSTTGYIDPPPDNMDSKKPKSVRACNAIGCSSDADF